MHLDDLPVELLHLICQQLLSCSDEYSPCSALRLVNKLFADVAAECILPSLDFNYARADFDAVLWFLRPRPRIAKGVKWLTFHTDRLPHYETYDTWDRHRRVAGGIEAQYAVEEDYEDDVVDGLYRGSERGHRARNRMLRKAEVALKGTHTQRELKNAYFCYQDLYADQKNLDEGDVLHEKLSEIFGLCSHIVELQLNSEDTHAYNPVDNLPAYQYAMMFPMGDPDEAYQGVKALTSTLSAASSAGSKLRVLSGVPLSYRFFTQDSAILDTTFPAMKSVRGIHLRPDAHQEIYRRPDREVLTRMAAQLQNGLVARFLGAAPSLEQLYFEMPGADDMPKVSLPNIVGTGTAWPDLKILELEHFETSRGDFVNFVLRHKALVQMCFRSVHLTTNDHWDDAFRDIAGKLPKLRNVHLGGDFTSENPSSFCVFNSGGYPNRRRRCATAYEHYILKGGEHPASEYEWEYLDGLEAACEEDDWTEPYGTKALVRSLGP